MTKEDKELLLKDLGARFPYHPFIYGKTGYATNEGRLIGLFSSGIHIMTGGGSVFHYFIEEVKPYLRPMSSMTEEEYKEYKKTCEYSENDEFFYPTFKTYDWLNTHHFDYRGLIEKGLALEALEGMYEITKTSI